MFKKIVQAELFYTVRTLTLKFSFRKKNSFTALHYYMHTQHKHYTERHRQFIRTQQNKLVSIVTEVLSIYSVKETERNGNNFSKNKIRFYFLLFFIHLIFTNTTNFFCNIFLNSFYMEVSCFFSVLVWNVNFFWIWF